jgi:hypothetical protein
VKEGQSTGTFNSLVFHTNSEVNVGFVGISDVSMAMSVTPWDDGLWERGPNFYPYTPPDYKQRIKEHCMHYLMVRVYDQ